MPTQVLWLATAGFGLVMTLGWLFVERRITTTGLIAAFTWTFLSIVGNDVYVLTNSGTEVESPIGNLQYFCAFLAVLSFLAVMLYRWGHYPPQSDDPTGETA